MAKAVGEMLPLTCHRSFWTRETWRAVGIVCTEKVEMASCQWVMSLKTGLEKTAQSKFEHGCHVHLLLRLQNAYCTALPALPPEQSYHIQEAGGKLRSNM
jgi:hypothetical protein